MWVYIYSIFTVNKPTNLSSESEEKILDPDQRKIYRIRIRGKYIGSGSEEKILDPDQRKIYRIRIRGKNIGSGSEENISDPNQSYGKMIWILLNYALTLIKNNAIITTFEESLLARHDY